MFTIPGNQGNYVSFRHSSILAHPLRNCLKHYSALAAHSDSMAIPLPVRSPTSTGLASVSTWHKQPLASSRARISAIRQSRP